MIFPPSGLRFRNEHRACLLAATSLLVPNYMPAAVALNSPHGHTSSIPPSYYAQAKQARKPAADANLQSLAAQISKLSGEARYSEALELAKAYAKQAKSKPGAKSEDYGTALSWMAFLYQVQGYLAEAQPLFEAAVEVYEAALPPGSPELATAVSNLGVQYWLSGKLDKAETAYKAALDLRERILPPDDPEIATSLNNIAFIYALRGLAAEAEGLHRRALAIRERRLGPKDPLIAQSLQNLATSLELQGKFRDAEAYIRRAVAVRKASQVPTHPEIAGVIAKLAHNLSSQGRLSEAEALFKEALRIRGVSQQPNHPDIAGTKEDLATVYLLRGDCAAADAMLQEALAIRHSYFEGRNLSVAGVLANQARAATCARQWRKALKLSREATQLFAEYDASNQAAVFHFENQMVTLWRLRAAHEGAPSDVNESLVLAQRASVTDAATSVARMAARLSIRDPKLAPLVRRRDNLALEQVRIERELDAALALPAKERRAHSDPLLKQLMLTKGEIKRIDERIRSEFPEYFSLIRPQPLDLPAIQKLLRHDEVLVTFYVGADDVFVWAIGDDGAQWQRAAITPQELSAAVSKLREALDPDSFNRLARKNELFDLKLAYDLYRRLLGPVAPMLKHKRQLFVVGSGPLTSLPLHVLIDAPPVLTAQRSRDLESYRAASWLARKYAIAVLPGVSSLSELRTLSAAPVGSKPLIGFADPVFKAVRLAQTDDGKRTRGLSQVWSESDVDFSAFDAIAPLPETAEELRAVAKAVDAPKQELYLGGAATETAVKSAGDLDQYRIVYFATHALLAGQLKGLKEPALVLAAPARPSERDDGLLTASEVSELKLNADWVILSACNTAAGGTPGAEALSGLAKAFFRAGARELLVSHWPVDSDAATALTTRTFSLLRNDPHLSHSQALRRSMLALIDDGNDPRNAYPAYWAPFILVGAD
jgi:CHAT domain-containing protein/Flp pilus assembly protein TadD